MYLCTSVRKIREIEQHWGVQRTFGCYPTHLAGWPSVLCEPQILCGGVASSTTQQGLCTMLWSLCGWRDLNRRGFVWASFHSFVFFLPCSCHFAFASNFPFFWMQWCACCFCVSASIHKLHWNQARRVSEKGLFSFPLRDWTDSGKRNLCEREQRGRLLVHPTWHSLFLAWVTVACFSLIFNSLFTVVYARFV